MQIHIHDCKNDFSMAIRRCPSLFNITEKYMYIVLHTETYIYTSAGLH